MLSTTIRNRIHKIISGNKLILENEDNQTNLKNVVNNCTLIENALRREFLEYRRLPRNKLNALIVDVLKKTFEGDGFPKGGGISGKGFQGSCDAGEQHGHHDYHNHNSHHDDKWQPGEPDELPIPNKGKKKKKRDEQLSQDGSKKVKNASLKMGESKTNEKVKKKKNLDFTSPKEKEKSQKDTVKEQSYLAHNLLKDVKKNIEADNTNLANYKGIKNIKKDIFYSIIYPHKFREGNFSTIINISGISGSGKTTLSYAIAGECDCPFFYLKLPEYVKYISNDSKNNKLKLIFEQIKNEYNDAILCIDDIDVILSSKDDSTDLYLFTYLLSLFDNSNVIVLLLSVSKPYDSVLYTKIKKFISIPIPTYEDRVEILEFMAEEFSLTFDAKYAAALTYGFHRGHLYDIANESMNLCIYDQVHGGNLIRIRSEMDVPSIERDSIEETKSEVLPPGGEATQVTTSPPNDAPHPNGENICEANNTDVSPNGGEEQECDLKSDTATTFYSHTLTSKQRNETNLKRKEWSGDASTYKVKRPKMSCRKVNDEIIQQSVRNIKKKMITENICEVPNINLDNIGSLKKIKKVLETKFILPVKYANIYKHLGINKSMGILLYGPPGCGKTMLAKAISNEMKANFIAIKGPEILNKYVGESEKKVREIFSYASIYKPCLIFFDEIDSICINRANNKAAAASDRIVNQLLTEMDGLSQRESVYIIATTNRPDIIDKALLRSGRFDQLIYISLPKYQGRIDILRKLSKNMPLHEDVDFAKISRLTKGYSGADLYGVLRESAFIALQECRDKIDLCNSGLSSRGDETQHFREADASCNYTSNEQPPFVKRENGDTVTDAGSSNRTAGPFDGGTKGPSQCAVATIDQSDAGECTQKGNIYMDAHLCSPRDDDNLSMQNNHTYKINNLKNKAISEKDKNNLIYEFIQRNKNILTISHKHIVMAIKMVPRSVTSKQMKYYKEISKKFK
ncbi:ATPase [Plasmodium coatneyi]|uniref:ATPase n=1 Tax=Plasmodium coatneyi TaxID=208452 RepID=A0A1B1E352_9APIC|nr:ATPase [Plasmodium coatneyi]ANQ09442.1 ATPase [Plasmodium coatneyi]